jgi:D-lactate dehydrogenase
MLSPQYRELLNRLSATLPEGRLIHDPLRTLTYGTDASFYRLIPQVVIIVETEEEVVAVLKETRRLQLPVTFRAAGTSLSGQAVTDSVLVFLGRTWKQYRIFDQGERIALQPGIIGAFANLYLAPYGRKIGPDPASINSAMIGGIAANNASGMCCGTAQNSYRTLASMRIIFRDGTILDTADGSSRREFLTSHGVFAGRVGDLARRVRAHQALAERIRAKYKMKNTTGYSLNALVDYEDPIEIIQHLMIGSEGTLGFIAEVTYRTVPELPHKATSLMLFPDIETACRAVPLLKKCPVDAVELMDRASLRSVENKSGMPSFLKDLDDRVAALLVETRSVDPDSLREAITTIISALAPLPTVRPIAFTTDAAEFTMLWSIRKGLFPSVGAMRATGTTVVIEDVAFPVPRLAEATLDLQRLFTVHGYHDAIIFGHALEGNLHFVFKQNFNSPSEVQRYGNFISDVTTMVVEKFDGSLKAEHGTGRNMAPFVELEWGAEAYALMHEIKSLFDPENLLNPGVILNADRAIHLQNLKPMPAAHPAIDKCIECGFCELNCPSKDITLTPRQRIVAYREIARLSGSHNNPDRLNDLKNLYHYYANVTCATDGLCALTCPVDIDTGTFIKDLRLRESGPVANMVATGISRHMGSVTAVSRFFLNVLHGVHRTVGTEFMESATAGLRNFTENKLPLWNRYMPRGAPALPIPAHNPANPRIVVYFPSCINRTMGTASGESPDDTVTGRTIALLQKAGFEVVYPEHLTNLCCGMPFASKGYKEQGDEKSRELEQAVIAASRNGEYPVLVDMSPCLYRMTEKLHAPLTLFDPARFILRHAAPYLEFHRRTEPVLIHHTCSARKMGLDQDLLELASLCAERVVVPRDVGCCGWAGDRGFTVPELNASALHELRRQVPPDCRGGYSTSRTCEIGMSLHSGVPYRSIVSLVDACTTARNDHSPNRNQTSDRQQPAMKEEHP